MMVICSTGWSSNGGWTTLAVIDRAGLRETPQSPDAAIVQKTTREWLVPELMSFARRWIVSETGLEGDHRRGPTGAQSPHEALQRNAQRVTHRSSQKSVFLRMTCGVQRFTL